MRAVLTNLGSAGDTQPLIALAVELRKHGHDATLALAPYYAQYVRKLGLAFAPIGPDLDYPELQRRETTAIMRGASVYSLLVDSLGRLISMLPQIFNELYDLCQQADVIISGQLQPASRMIHELTRIPFVSIQTNHFGREQEPIAREMIASVVNSFRAEHGLNPIRDPMHTDANSPQLALYAISCYFRPPSTDWPQHYHTTGFFFMPADECEPGLELVEFLEAGEKPVVITFSSLAHEDPERLTSILLDAISRAGCRVIIQRGWSGLCKGDLPPWALAIDFVQHTWLFKRASCVVHAGGPGTAAAAIRAGVPAVVVPHVGDQPIWAHLVKDLGCAGFIIPYQELTAERLANAIVATLRTERYYEAVSIMSNKVRAEDGVATARRLIEELAQKLAPDQSIETGAASDGLLSEGAENKINRRRQYQKQQRNRRHANSEKLHMEE